MISKILVIYAFIIIVIEMITALPYFKRKDLSVEANNESLIGLILLAIAIRYITGY